MRNILKRNKNKMDKRKGNGHRRYARGNAPQRVHERLKELHTYLTMREAMDSDGYVPSSYDDICKTSGMTTTHIGIMVNERMLIRATNTAEGLKFKYKWNTIPPTLDMAVKLLDVAHERHHQHIIEGEAAPTAEVHSDEIENNRPEAVIEDDEPVKEEVSSDFPTIMDYNRNGDELTIRINLANFNTDENEVNKHLMSFLSAR
jgi:hypothetical protein